jgi:hypothetical protein
MKELVEELVWLTYQNQIIVFYLWSNFKLNQYKVYNIGNIENMVSYKRGKGHVPSVERHP